MTHILGHIKWFAEDAISSQIASLSAAEWLVVALAILLGVGILLLLDKVMKKPDKVLDDKFKPLRKWIPTVIRWSTAIVLIASYWQGNLYASNIEYSASVLSSFVNVALVAIAILLILGVYTRVAGVVMLIVYLGSILVVADPIQLLDHLVYAGTGLFLVFSEVGKLSVNEKLVDPL